MDWTNYIKANLFSQTDLNIYSGNVSGEGRFLLEHLSNYEALGVRYIVAAPGDDLESKSFPLADLAGDVIKQNTTDYALWPNRGDLTGDFVVDLSSTSIKSASIFVGTYRGLARGSLIMTLCAAGQCETAANDVGHAKDTAPLMFNFPAPLAVPQGAELSYRFSHPNGTVVTIWLVPAGSGIEVPSFAFFGSNNTALEGVVHSDLSLVFKDDTTSIYQLANAVPYASSPNAACNVEILNRQDMHTSCISQGTLVRREMYFPGWSVLVNGKAKDVSRSGLFQIIAIPAGNADIKFSYAPPHLRLAAILATISFMVWFALSFRVTKLKFTRNDSPA
jgi:hypothetical protein